MPDSPSPTVRALDQVRHVRPLIHLITNFVTMNDVANALLAVGARPVMAHALEEVETITRSAGALVLNLGTPSNERIDAMQAAGKAANEANIPIVFDPVGIGASEFRRASAERLLDSLQMAIVRGNASEIGVLAGMSMTQSGVDAGVVQYDRTMVAKSLAQKYAATIAITGVTDIVSDGSCVASIENGDPWLNQITGAGDISSALIGAAASGASDPFIAAVSGLIWLGIAAECAAETAQGVGSFRIALFDALGKLDASIVKQRAQVTITKDKQV